MLPTAAATNAGPACEGTPAITAASAHAGAMVTSATNEPPNHLPSTICHVGVGDSHVKWNVPARTSAPSTESPMTSAAIGITNPNSASAAMLAKARSGVASTARLSRPNNNAPAHGNKIAAHRRGGTQDCNV